MKRIMVALMVLTILFPVMALAEGSYPKLAIYWTAPIMHESEAHNLGRIFDLIIVDMENVGNNPRSLDIIKLENPEAKILIYSNPIAMLNKFIILQWLCN